MGVESKEARGAEKDLLIKLSQICTKGSGAQGVFSRDVVPLSLMEVSANPSRLPEWISRNTGDILKEYISESFCTSHGLDKPTVDNKSDNCSLSPCLDSTGTVVVMLLLWSRCGQHICQQIIACLDNGAKHFKGDQIQFLVAYARCIRSTILHSVKQMYERAKTITSWTEGIKEDLKKALKNATILGALCLSQAVESSSRLFSISTLPRHPSQFLILSEQYLENFKPSSNFLQQASHLNTDEIFHCNTAVVKHVSLMDYLRMVSSVTLTAVTRLKPMKDILTKHAHCAKHQSEQENDNGDMPREVTKAAAKALNLVTPAEDYVEARLLCFALLLDNHWTYKDSSSIFKSDTFLRILFGTGILGNFTKENMKNMVKSLVEETQPTLFEHRAVKAIIDQPKLASNRSKTYVDAFEAHHKNYQFHNDDAGSEDKKTTSMSQPNLVGSKRKPNTFESSKEDKKKKKRSQNSNPKPGTPKTAIANVESVPIKAGGGDLNLKNQTDMSSYFKRNKKEMPGSCQASIEQILKENTKKDEAIKLYEDYFHGSIKTKKAAIEEVAKYISSEMTGCSGES